MGWEWVIYLVVSIVLSIALAPKQQTQNADPAKSLDLPQADEGTAQAVIFGDCWSSDWMVLGHGNYRTTEIRK